MPNVLSSVRPPRAGGGGLEKAETEGQKKGETEVQKKMSVVLENSLTEPDHNP